MLQQGLAFKGFSVEATDGKIGTVSDFLFDDSTWALRWLVIDTGTWLTDRKLLLHPTVIDKADMRVKALLVKLTRSQVEQSPSIASDEPVSMQMEYNLYGYYGLDPSWGGYHYGGNAMEQPAAVTNMPVPVSDTANGRRGPDPHLRSLLEVTGYNIHATDGDIGHIETFLIDDAGWDIKYLQVDTRNWWFGQHVLLSPASVTAIRWDEHRVDINLTCYKIKNSPPWDATALIDRAYETLLQAYYSWPDKLLPAKHANVAQQETAKPAKAPLETV